MNHDSMIEVIAAHRDGKEVQFRRFSETGRKWKDLKTGFAARDNFDFISYDYRIKPSPPKPREFNIRIDKHGIPSRSLYLEMGDEVIHVREVLPSKGEEFKITWRQSVLMWLGQWRDKMPAEAVSDLQDIVREPKEEEEIL